MNALRLDPVYDDYRLKGPHYWKPTLSDPTEYGEFGQRKKEHLCKNLPDMYCHRRACSREALHSKSWNPNANVTVMGKALLMSNPLQTWSSIFLHHRTQNWDLNCYPSLNQWQPWLKRHGLNFPHFGGLRQQMLCLPILYHSTLECPHIADADAFIRELNTNLREIHLG